MREELLLLLVCVESEKVEMKMSRVVEQALYVG